jgi:hypothetical protein
VAGLCRIEGRQLNTLDQKQTSRVFKIASCATMAVALVLELLPRNLFDAKLSVQLLQHLFSISQRLLSAHFDVEQIYPGYGNKFVLSCLLLFLGFLTSAVYSIFATLRVNPKIQISPELENSKFRNFLICLGVLLFILVAQFIGLGLHLNPSGGKGNTAPFFYRGLMWVMAEGAIVMLVVLLRRGNWRNAS